MYSDKKSVKAKGDTMIKTRKIIFICSIILSVAVLINIVFLNNMWWQLDDMAYADSGFKDVYGWGYLGYTERRGVYIEGIVFLVGGIWLSYIVKQKIVPIIITALGGALLISSFLTASHGADYELLGKAAGHVTDNYYVAQVYGIVCAVAVMAAVIAVSVIGRKSSGINAKNHMVKEAQ